jgi:hypothetical protein
MREILEGELAVQIDIEHFVAVMMKMMAMT